MKFLTAPIPSTGELLPRLGLGTYKTFDIAVPSPAATEAAAVLKAFYDHGGRLIDSSPMYGAAEAVTGQLSTQLGINAGLFIATKVWTEGAEQGKRQMEDSIHKLGRKNIELMQVHNLVDFKTHWPLLKAWKAASRLRYIGVTHYSTAAFGELERILKTTPMDFLQIPYSIGETAAAKSLIPLAAEKGVAVIANEPFQKGQLVRGMQGKALPGWVGELGIKTWSQFFLKYILADPAVPFVIPATGKLAHLLDFLPGGEGPLPTLQQRERMRKDWMAA